MAKSEKFDPENVIISDDSADAWGMGAPQNNIPLAYKNPLRTDEVSCGYVAALVTRAGKVLCGLRSDGQGWCGPGGHIEPGETPLDAIRREAKEEFGISLSSLRYVGNCGGKTDEILPVQIYICDNCSDDPQADRVEILRHDWFTVEQIVNQEVPGNVVFEPFKRSVAIYLSE